MKGLLPPLDTSKHSSIEHSTELGGRGHGTPYRCQFMPWLLPFQSSSPFDWETGEDSSSSWAPAPTGHCRSEPVDRWSLSASLSNSAFPINNNKQIKKKIQWALYFSMEKERRENERLWNTAKWFNSIYCSHIKHIQKYVSYWLNIFSKVVSSMLTLKLVFKACVPACSLLMLLGKQLNLA